MSHEPTQSAASSIRPLLQGDEINGQPVRGFAWRAPNPGLRSDHHDDALLLDGDESRTSPPDRPVPVSSDGARAIAPVPPADLRPELQIRAAELSTTLAGRVDALLDLPAAPWKKIIRPLLAAVHANGHRLWLAGGAVRDALCEVPPSRTHDLDMSGTVPTGRFVDIAYQTLRATGRTDQHLISVCPDDLVCGIGMLDADAAIEYRGLSTGGFPFPVVGSRLAEDAVHRDFTFNSLVYDVLDHQVFDPTGRGLRDLLVSPRTFTPLKKGGKLIDLALLTVRATKFRMRWGDAMEVDLGPLRRRLQDLPANAWESLTEDQWINVRTEWRKITQDADRQREFARSMPGPGEALLMSLIGGA